MRCVPCASLYSRTQKPLSLSVLGGGGGCNDYGTSRGDFHAISLEFYFLDRDAGCITVKRDSMGAANLANIPAKSSSSKCIAVRHQFIRERVANGEFKLVHVRSAERHADLFTKPLHAEAFRFHRNM